jgi:hypothetical protein
MRVDDDHFISWEGALEGRDKRRKQYERNCSPLTRKYLSWSVDDPRLHRNHTGYSDYDLDLECLVPEAGTAWTGQRSIDQSAVLVVRDPDRW